MANIKREQMSLVDTVMIHKATGKSCRVVAQSAGDIAAQIVYTVKFKDGQQSDCRQHELSFFETIEDRIRAEALFPI
jgi:hypothetical protein